ncbi:MAG: DUF1236 domain-containing protein [Xanthobacteraceae bacterium]
MKTYFGHAAVALALVAGTGPASAQWIYDNAPVARAPIVAAQPLALTQAQRTIIYRTIIPQGRNRQPIVREQIITEPVVRERVVTQPYAYDGDYYAYGYETPATPRVVVREPDGYGSYARGGRYAYGDDYAYGSYAYAVGTRIPPAARLAPFPRTVVTAVPAVRSYRYMVINNRLLLVDPATSMVVAEVTE